MPLRRIGLSFRGEGLKARTVRGTSLTVIAFGGTNVLRLAGNLILTRLLFPEAFGLMAIVQVFMSGIEMFSDVGIRSSVIRSDRGDAEAFLNTAWTMQILRGFVLWIAACALAWPAAAIYGEPLLAQLLPVVGLNAIIAGFTTTNVHSQNRHMRLGGIVGIDLLSQFLGLCLMVGLAWWLQSVWALVYGALVGNLIKLFLMHRLLPGIRNRLRLEWSSLREIISFGKYIFLSTITAFVINQSDKAILGTFVSFAALGVYNIGFFLGTTPYVLAKMVANRVIFPLYRMRHPLDSDDNRRKIFQMRRLSTLGALSAAAILAFSGPALVRFLYDPRYEAAGAIVSLIAFASVPMITFEGNMRSAMARGDSRSFFLVFLALAVVQVVLLYFGTQQFGIMGAVLSLGLAPLLTYPLRVRVLIRYRSWDAVGELGLMILGLVICGWACFVHRELIFALIEI